MDGLPLLWLIIYSPHIGNLVHRENKNDSNVATGIGYGVASLVSWFEFICDPETSITRMKGHVKTITSFQRWTYWASSNKLAYTCLPQGQAHKFPTWLVENVQLKWNDSIVIGWTICGRVHQNPSAMKVIHLNTILAFDGLAMEFLWDPIETLDLSHSTHHNIIRIFALPLSLYVKEKTKNGLGAQINHVP